ncbi:hypothetical protein OS493_026736 [Desmophyllum pertusum]|uniref:Uncharacterized protein n=1 Tax=Desmophyllum pertusum TaxID=174260 RepID=A0A9X0D809_9CNID|nr:hypothetical protein OS493_026736 [Desmophyllum pertusum]
MKNKGSVLRNRRGTQISPSDDQSSEIKCFEMHSIGISEKDVVTTITPMRIIDAPISCRYHIIKLYMRDSAMPSTSSTARKQIMCISQHRYAKVLPSLKFRSDFCSGSFKTAPKTKDTAPKMAKCKNVSRNYSLSQNHNGDSLWPLLTPHPREQPRGMSIHCFLSGTLCSVAKISENMLLLIPFAEDGKKSSQKNTKSVEL